MNRLRPADGTRALSHVLVCGGSLDEWERLEFDGWARFFDVLMQALESSGSRWLTVCPYDGILEVGQEDELVRRIAQVTNGTISANRVTFIGRNGMVGIVDICANGQRRFVEAVNSITSSALDEGMIAASILAPATDDPDLILVFGPPTRVPPALMWELAYGELVFLDTPWISCNVEHVHMAVDDFQRRDRRFGGIDS